MQWRYQYINNGRKLKCPNANLPELYNAKFRNQRHNTWKEDKGIVCKTGKEEGKGRIDVKEVGHATNNFPNL